MLARVPDAPGRATPERRRLLIDSAPDIRVIDAARVIGDNSGNGSRAMETMIVREAAAVLAAADSLPDADDLTTELAVIDAAGARGYFLPDEEELVRLRYSQYLSLRASLLETLRSVAAAAGGHSIAWKARLPAFATAFAAACVLVRADRFLVELAAGRPVLWKKLDEADPRAGIPRKTFTAVYKALSDPLDAGRFLMAADFYQKNRRGILELRDDPVMAAVVDLLEAEEPRVGRSKRDAVRRAASYRWFSFLRRNRSAWKKTMFGLFEVSGRAVAELRQPGIKPAGAPKRITAELRGEILRLARPGDVFVTRHDDALSNLFLPGFWPHAALYLGTAEEMRTMGLRAPEESGGWFLESKKDGVRVRPAEETLQVDALVILRPPLGGGELAEGLRRAAGHEGKAYDFLFDFRTADRMVCTEVIYRGFHGIGPVSFHLKEVGGRLCLPAEELLDQAIACGFQVQAAAGLRGDRISDGPEAGEAFRESRKPAPEALPCAENQKKRIE